MPIAQSDLDTLQAKLTTLETDKATADSATTAAQVTTDLADLERS